jgi:nitrite reductase (NADH) large subunit
MVAKLVIVGDGVAGVVAARTIARMRPEARIDLYGCESHYYYRRPRLWEYLSGQIAEEDLRSYPPTWYRERGIRVHRGERVTGIAPEGSRITLADGRTPSYDRLLLATGSHPCVPPIPGIEKEGVFTLRTIEDARRIRACARRARKAVVIGGGLLGLETARALSILGLGVTVLELFPRLLPRQLDAEGAAVLAKKMEQMGLTVVTGAVTKAILGEDRAEGVLLSSGEHIHAGLFLISAGVLPNVALAQQARLTIGRGVIVDEYMRSSCENIYAAGDVAEYRGKLPSIIPAAIAQGRVAGMHMADGDPKPYRGVTPSYVLKSVGISLMSIGITDPQGGEYQELRRADDAGQRYRKLVLKDGRLVGAIMVGETEGTDTIRRLIADGAEVSGYAERLLDGSYDQPCVSARL